MQLIFIGLVIALAVPALVLITLFHFGRKRLKGVKSAIDERRIVLRGKSATETEYGEYVLRVAQDRSERMSEIGSFLSGNLYEEIERFDRAMGSPPVDVQYQQANGKSVEQGAREHYADCMRFGRRGPEDDSWPAWEDRAEEHRVTHRNLIRNWFLIREERTAARKPTQIKL